LTAVAGQGNEGRVLERPQRPGLRRNRRQMEATEIETQGSEKRERRKRNEGRRFPNLD
jgi:hypothetical protein